MYFRIIRNDVLKEQSHLADYDLDLCRGGGHAGFARRDSGRRIFRAQSRA